MLLSKFVVRSVKQLKASRYIKNRNFVKILFYENKKLRIRPKQGLQP